MNKFDYIRMSKDNKGLIKSNIQSILLKQLTSELIIATSH